MKKLICCCLVILLLTGFVHGKTSSQLRKELDALQSQADTIRAEGAELEKQLQSNASETQSIIDRKFAIDQQIRQTEREMENADQQIRQYNLLIAQKQSDVEQAQEAYGDMYETYKLRLRAMEERGRVSYWSILFKASSFSDLLDRITMIREIAKADQAMLQSLQTAADLVEQERSLLQADLREQEQVKLYLAELEGELSLQRAEADRCLKELQYAHDNLTEEYAAISAQEAAMQAQIMAAQAAYAQALSAEAAAQLAQMNQNNAAGSSDIQPSASGFLCPVSGAFITDAYGWRIHPKKKVESFHTGVDFAVGHATPICAMAAGTVSDCGSNNSYGNYVTLTHGGGYGSFYGHMSQYVVSAGETVSQGQVIGYVGSTGISTGPHLHFEIYVNGGTVNPMEYVSLS